MEALIARVRRVAGLALAWVAIAVAIASAGGCRSVAPWERETLASPRMALEPDEDEAALVGSRRATREEGHVGAPGSSGSGAAGGCGCN